MSWFLRCVIKCHLEQLKTHCRGVLGLYLIAPPVMMSYSSRDHGLKVGRLVAPHNNSRDQQQQQRQVNMELLNPYDSDSKALLHPSQKCFPLSCHLPVPTASGKSHLKSPFFCPLKSDFKTHTADISFLSPIVLEIFLNQEYFHVIYIYGNNYKN